MPWICYQILWMRIFCHSVFVFPVLTSIRIPLKFFVSQASINTNYFFPKVASLMGKPHHKVTPLLLLLTPVCVLLFPMYCCKFFFTLRQWLIRNLCYPRWTVLDFTFGFHLFNLQRWCHEQWIQHVILNYIEILIKYHKLKVKNEKPYHANKHCLIKKTTLYHWFGAKFDAWKHTFFQIWLYIYYIKLIKK